MTFRLPDDFRIIFLCEIKQFLSKGRETERYVQETTRAPKEGKRRGKKGDRYAKEKKSNPEKCKFI